MKEKQCWRLASRGDLPAPRGLSESHACSPSAMSWKASAGYACEMDMPPDMQIRLLAQQVNFHCIADEVPYIECLRSHGVEETSALDAYRFIQIALGRRLPAVKAVRFTDTFFRFDREGRCIDVGYLSDQALFVEATKLARSAFTPRATEVIGHSSPEVQEALAQMAGGVRPRNVSLRLCVLFTAVPNPALVKHVERLTDTHTATATSARPVRPWWTRWRTGSLKGWPPRAPRR
jgi:hypothetical protein